MSEAERLADLLDRMADSGKYGAHHSTFHDTATLIRAQSARIAALEDALQGLEPYLDAIVCYASDMGEHEPNRLAFNARKALGKGSE